ncbi:uncharacterized protein LOC141854706 [Brevipalpus obovatus]|uniref:uncharacterized protein LOC141854706 n=1 Tax=Brevipalpus obovatus TaxID=246614 RepID=UPI003D9F422D
MPTIDWKFIASVNDDDIDDDKVEILYDQLFEIDPEDFGVDKLRVAFRAAQKVMHKKAMEADTAMEELDSFMNQTDRTEVESLRKELQMYKLSSSSSSTPASSSSFVQQHDTDEKSLAKMREYQVKLKENQDTLDRQAVELAKGKRKIVELERKTQINEKEMENLREEIEMLREELDSSRNGLQDTLIESQQPIERLREKNKQIQELLNELSHTESVSIDLAKQVKILKDQLESATEELSSAGDEMEKLRDQLHEVQEINTMLLDEKEYLLNELDTGKTQSTSISSSSSSSLSDREMVEKLRAKVKKLKQNLYEKTEEMEKIQASSQGTLQSSVAGGQDLMKELQEKINQADFLKAQLDVAVNDIETQNQMIEKLMGRDGLRMVSMNRSHESGEDQIIHLRDQVNLLREKIDHLEDELRSKDEELHHMIMIKEAYKRGEYGLPQALNEIKSLSKLVSQKDASLEEMVQTMNQLNSKLSSYQEQVDNMKEISRLAECLTNNHNSSVLTPSTTPLMADSSGKDARIIGDLSIRERLKVLRLQQTVVKLEDEKIALQEELRQRKALMLASSIGIRLETSASPTLPVTGHQQPKSNQPATATTPTAAATASSRNDERKFLEHLKELEDENKQLQLGMKEILMSLRESDTHTDVIIDCPSLERLVSLLESRSLNIDLTNAIALKAELDILRGHNQQLRMELKRLRQQHLKLISDYSNEILNTSDGHETFHGVEGGGRKEMRESSNSGYHQQVDGGEEVDQNGKHLYVDHISEDDKNGVTVADINSIWGKRLVSCEKSNSASRMEEEEEAEAEAEVEDGREGKEDNFSKVNSITSRSPTQDLEHDFRTGHGGGDGEKEKKKTKTINDGSKYGEDEKRKFDAADGCQDVFNDLKCVGRRDEKRNERAEPSNLDDERKQAEKNDEEREEDEGEEDSVEQIERKDIRGNGEYIGSEMNGKDSGNTEDRERVEDKMLLSPLNDANDLHLNLNVHNNIVPTPVPRRSIVAVKMVHTAVQADYDIDAVNLVRVKEEEKESYQIDQSSQTEYDISQSNVTVDGKMIIEVTKDDTTTTTPTTVIGRGSCCSRCKKLLDYVVDIKDHIQKLANSIKDSEESYLQQIETLESENKRLQDEVEMCKDRYQHYLETRRNVTSENQVNSLLNLNNSFVNHTLATTASSGDKIHPRTLRVIEYHHDHGVGGGGDGDGGGGRGGVGGIRKVDDNDEGSCRHRKVMMMERGMPIKMRKTLVKVLETIMNCLQSRIDQKEVAIKGYENMMRTSHENYQLEMKKLIELKFA